MSIDNLNIVDWVVFGLVFLCTIGAVLYAHKKRDEVETSWAQRLVLGRQLTMPLFIGTLGSTWYGGIFGTAQIAYENGIFNFITQGFFWYLSYLILAFFLIKPLRSFNGMTLPHLVGKIAGPKSEKYAALLNVLNLLPMAYMIGLAYFINMIFPTVSFEWGLLIGTAVILASTLWGSFRAVVYTDFIQFVTMFLAITMVFIVCFINFGTEPLNQLPPQYFSIKGNATWSEVFLWGLIAFGTLVNPNFYQRIFAASSEETAKKGLLITTGFWVIFDLSLTFGAMYAKSLGGELPPGQAYFIFSLDILPHGLKGFFLAGVMATIMSTLDSYLYLGGSTLAYDLFSHKEKHLNRIQTASIVGIAVLGIVLSLAFEGNIKNTWLFFGSLMSATLLPPMMMYLLFKRKTDDKHFLNCLIIGTVICLVIEFFIETEWSGTYFAWPTLFIYLGFVSKKISTGPNPHK
jgi:SSS family solute:Na+ symporter